MKLAKTTSYTDDVQTRVERETYLRHCDNIARIIAAAPRELQEAIDLYLTTTNANIEPAP